MRFRSALAVSLVLLVAAGRARADELLVHAAVSLSDALKDVAKLHEAHAGVQVKLDLAGSSTLARQLLAGAPGDVFFSADEATMDQLDKAKLLLAGTRRSLLSNTLVVVVGKDSTLHLASSADLARPEVKSVALADPSSVPAGVYAKEHLQRVHVWDAVLPKVVPTENVRAALAAVESGNVDAALVYATDASISSHVRVACEIPADQAPEISYPVAVLAGSSHPDAARAFVSFLGSPEASEAFRAHGFGVRSPAPASTPAPRP